MSGDATARRAEPHGGSARFKVLTTIAAFEIGARIRTVLGPRLDEGGESGFASGSVSKPLATVGAVDSTMAPPRVAQQPKHVGTGI
jgi:hypothetical protein